MEGVTYIHTHSHTNILFLSDLKWALLSQIPLNKLEVRGCSRVLGGTQKSSVSPEQGSPRNILNLFNPGKTREHDRKSRRSVGESVIERAQGVLERE